MTQIHKSTMRTFNNRPSLSRRAVTSNNANSAGFLSCLFRMKVSLITAVFGACLAFYGGTVFGSSLISLSDHSYSDINRINDPVKREKDELKFTQKDVDRKLEEEISKWKKSHEENVPQNNHNNDNDVPKNLKAVTKGMARMNAYEFNQAHDYGYPMQISPSSSAEVLMMYIGKQALPSKDLSDDGPFGPLLSVKDATEKCEAMNVVTVGTHVTSNTCLVVQSGYDSFHLQHWMRSGDPTKGQEAEVKRFHPFRHVSRGMKSNGADDFHPPKIRDIEKHWGPLRRYLENFDDVTKRLKPLLKNIAINNTIIVMVCNMGQASLLMNFACSAKARGFDLDNVLVFATDQETLEMAEGLGLTAFYDEKVSAFIKGG